MRFLKIAMVGLALALLVSGCGATTNSASSVAAASCNSWTDPCKETHFLWKNNLSVPVTFEVLDYDPSDWHDGFGPGQRAPKGVNGYKLAAGATYDEYTEVATTGSSRAFAVSFITPSLATVGIPIRFYWDGGSTRWKWRDYRPDRGDRFANYMNAAGKSTLARISFENNQDNGIQRISLNDAGQVSPCVLPPNLTSKQKAAAGKAPPKSQNTLQFNWRNWLNVPLTFDVSAIKNSDWASAYRPDHGPPLGIQGMTIAPWTTSRERFDLNTTNMLATSKFNFDLTGASGTAVTPGFRLVISGSETAVVVFGDESTKKRFSYKAADGAACAGEMYLTKDSNEIQSAIISPQVEP